MKVYDTLKNEMFTYTENGIRSFKNLDFGKTGLYEGEGSIVYAYLCLYKRSNEQIYLQYAEKHAQIVRKLLKQDQRYDVLSGNAELRGVLYSRILCYEFAENKKMENRLELDIKRAYKKLQEYWKRDSDCLCHGNCGNF